MTNRQFYPGFKNIRAFLVEVGRLVGSKVVKCLTIDDYPWDRVIVSFVNCRNSKSGFPRDLLERQSLSCVA